MRCNEIEPLMINYLNDELLGSQRKLLDEHLDKCETCRNNLIKLQNLELNLEDPHQINPPEDLIDKVLSTIPSEEPNIPYLSKILFSIISAGIILIIIFALIYSIKINSKKEGFRQILFSYSDPNANSVEITGDFNKWGRDTLIKSERTNWTITLKLNPGQYYYNFIVNKTSWVTDPKAEINVNDGYGNKNSIIYVHGTLTKGIK
ncbi:MAG: zf-HC2 domain-containing protein [bacterium]